MILTTIMVSFGSSAHGQTITGQVVDSLTQSAVGSGFVVLIGSDGREIERTLTASDGTFSFAVTQGFNEVVHLRSERIGYLVSVTEPFSPVAISTVHHVIWVKALPRSLANIEVAETSECGMRPELNELTTSVWEEARKALTAASWTAAKGLYGMVSTVYERDTDGRRRPEKPERHWPHRGRMTSPFVSQDPDVLMAEGYVVGRGESSDYFAPDAHILQDEGFIGSHCFRLTEDKEDPDVIGLAFEPAPSRRKPDVEGVLWLDRASSELRSLAYSYTNLPRHLRSSETGGGTIEFMALPSGAWIVRRWEIGIPTSFRTERVNPFAIEPRRLVNAFKENGGEVLSVTDSTGSVVYRAEMAQLVALVVRETREGLEHVPGVTVTIEDTWFSNVSDEVGVAHIAAPLDGEYGVVFSNGDTEALGFRPASQRTTLVRGQSDTLILRLPSMNEVLEALCEAPVTSDRFRVIVGTVRDSNTDLPISGALVTATWQDVRKNGQGQFDFRDRYVTSSTDDSGYYAICGLQLVRPNIIVAQHGRSQSSAVRIAFEPDGVEIGGAFQATTYPYLRYDIPLSYSNAGGSGLSGLLTDIVTGTPLSDVVVVADDGAVSTRSDSTGVVQLDLSPGKHRIVLQKPGYAVRVGEIEVASDRASVLGAGFSALTPVVQLIGLVRDSSTSEAVTGAWVTLVTAAGDSVAIARSDSSGRFVLTALESDDYSLTARRIGYTPAAVGPFELEPGVPRQVTVTMGPAGYELDPITVVGEAAVAHLARHGFYRRREFGQGHFMDRTEIESRSGASNLSQLLVGLNGVTVGGNGYIRLRGGPGCSQQAPSVWLDGIRLLTDPGFGAIEDWHELVPTIDMEALEIYTRPSQVPAEYNTGGEAACGVILIWTRRGG